MKHEVIVRLGQENEVSDLLKLIRELADYEKAPHEVVITEEILRYDGFGPVTHYQFYVAIVNDEIVGIALFYYKYSTWKGRCIYLEDIIVRESHRGRGIGSALFETVLQRAESENVKRVEWQVLDWNEPAIKFYRKYNAEINDEWLNGRILL